jgi:hypothetical protein
LGARIVAAFFGFRSDFSTHLDSLISASQTPESFDIALFSGCRHFKTQNNCAADYVLIDSPEKEDRTLPKASVGK